MIKVKFFGVLRIDHKVKYLEVETANTVSELMNKIGEMTEIPLDELKGCSYFVNNKLSKMKTPLKAGDEVMVMIPVAGG